MNLSKESAVIVDCDITMKDQKRSVNHLYLVGKNKTITNSDRYYINYGGADVTKLCFLWDKPQVIDPADNYSAVIVYLNYVPGPDGKFGYGGKCFPKDVNAFAKMTEGTPLGTLLEHLHELNVHFRGVEEHI